MSKFHEFEHPTLGRLNGTVLSNPFNNKDDADIIQFRSVPYGRIPARFHHATLLSTLPQNFDHRPHRDFTTYGTICPQHVRALTPAIYGGPLPGDQDGPRQNEFTCLNVTISIPKSVCRNTANMSGRLPVMAFIHGGAFAEGTSESIGFHDLSRLVALSVTDGNPIVAVTINYRVGLLGNLACDDLVEEQSHDGSGVNTSLHDQRMALQWIQRFIPGFGGDAAAVTCFGQSAGGVSTFMHLYSAEELFRRAIVQSGNAGAGWPTIEDWESRYQSVLDLLQIREGDRSSRLQRLREVSAEKLIDAAQQLRIYPTYPLLSEANTSWSGHGIPKYSNALEMLQGNHWCKEVMIGDMANEGFMFNFLVGKMTFRGVQSHFSKVLGREMANKLLTTYEISSNTEVSAFRLRVAQLFGDLNISEPIERIYSHFKSSPERKDQLTCIRYRVDLPNPIEGALFEGIPGVLAKDWPASHGYDLMYLLLTLIDRYPEDTKTQDRAIAMGMAREWIQFAHGTISQPILNDNGRKEESAITGVQISSSSEIKISRAAGVRAIQEVYETCALAMSEADAPNENRELDRIRASLLDFGSLIKASM